MLVVAIATAPGCRPDPPPPPASAPLARATAESLPASPDVTRRLLLFALDGATWKVIDPLLAAGRLPNLQRLIDNGLRGPLATIEPSVSPMLWTTIATGQKPERHGITDFVAKDAAGESTTLPTSNLRRVAAIWNILSDAGRKVGVVGWWATYPAEPVNGFVISDHASVLRKRVYKDALELTDRALDHTEDGEIHPAALGTRLRRDVVIPVQVPDARLAGFFDLPAGELAKLAAAETMDRNDLRSVFKFSLLIDDFNEQAALLAIDSEKPDFATVYIDSVDAAEHHFWKFHEPQSFPEVSPADIKRYGKTIARAYEHADEILGRLLERFPLESSTVLVVSDHGHEANPNHRADAPEHFDRICSGSHHQAPDGILILAGKDIRPGARLVGPTTIYAVAPTVLALFGVAPSLEMPGRVIEEAIEPAFLGKHPPRRVPNYPFTPPPPPSSPSRMGDTLKERLRGLGYIQ